MIKNKPFRVTIALTGRCNMKCKHCFASHGNILENEMDTYLIKDIIKQLAKLQVVEIILTGGEPFLKEDFFEIAAFCRSNSMRVSVNTNGTLINEETISRMKQVPIEGLITVSIDGYNPETYDAIRGTGNFNKMDLALDSLKNNGFSVRGFCAITKYNMDYIEKIANYSLKKLVKSIEYNILQMTEDVKPYKNHLEMSLQERLNVANEVYRLYRKHGDVISGAYLYWGKLFNGDEKKNNTVNSLYPCGAASSSFTIKPNGDIVPCDALWSCVAGNVRNETIEYIWYNSDIFNELRLCSNLTLENLKPCKGCLKKFECHGGCRASAFNSTGTFKSGDYFCQENMQIGVN